MLFSSLEFLFLFLPLCLAAYYILPYKARNVILLLFSLIFYAFGEPIYLFLMIFTILSNYAFAILTEKFSDKKKAARAILALAIVLNLAILGFFKYYDPICIALSRLPSLAFIRPLGLSLPVGISFYTFQSLSYVIDVYRKESSAARSPLVPATYVTLFPQLIAGPIIKYNDIEGQIRERHHSLSLIADGIRRFSAGLAKKVLLANTAGELWKDLCIPIKAGNADTLGAWLAVIFFAFQIYFDFSGYSDMAIGLGKMFGFDFPENFNYPYISRSITEFWRRWHITLSSWFRDYVYISLGGNRRGKARMYLNLFIVWSLTGIWHGAGINFLLWGLYFFLLLSIEKLFLLKLLEKLPRAFGHIYALVAILLGWLIFAADGAEGSIGASSALYCARAMFGIGAPISSQLSRYELMRNLVPLFLMCVASLPYFKKLCLYAMRSERLEKYAVPLLNTASFLVFILCISYLVNSGYNPFLYFRF